MTRSRARHIAFVIGSLAALWAIAVLWTGGGMLYIFGIRLSSRGARNAVVLTFLSAAVAWLLAPAGQRREALSAECEWLYDILARRLRWLAAIPQPTRVVAAIATAWVVLVGLTEGAFVVGGSDSYGYVSQAHLWSIGELRQQPALFRELSSQTTLDVLAPLGYRPTVDGMTIAPTYSPGLPLFMAIFERLFGPGSVFWVVPILGGVLVLSTYLLGSRVHGPLAGAVAAVLVATSPPVLFQITAAPMSDLPAAAWWALALVLIATDSRAGALAAGAAAGMAVLTRPNLAPLLAIAGGLLLWRLLVAKRSPWRVLQHAMMFAVFSGAACVTIGVINRSWWGSVLQSGYGSLSDLYSLANVQTNLLFYPLVSLVHMPAVLLVPIAALMHWRRPHWREEQARDRTMMVALGAFVAVVYLAYLAYPLFDSDWNLRFILTAVSPLLVLASIAAVWLAGRLSAARQASVLAAALIVVGGYGVDYARDRQAFQTGHLRKFADVGGSIARQLPPRTVLLAMLHSGSATYYSGRPTLRWDLLPPSDLDRLVSELIRHEYVPYLLLDVDERAAFQSRYRGYSRLAELDWPPVITLSPPDVQVYAVPEASPRP